MDHGSLAAGYINIGVVIMCLVMGELARVSFYVVLCLTMGELVRVSFDVFVLCLAMRELTPLLYLMLFCPLWPWESWPE